VIDGCVATVVSDSISKIVLIVSEIILIASTRSGTVTDAVCVRIRILSG
jgi:hypothetical protein